MMMRSPIRLALLLLFASALACATAAERDRDLDQKPLTLEGARPPMNPGDALIQGLVRDDESRKPIANAEVLIQSLGEAKEITQQRGSTDAKGRFQLVVPPDSYAVIVDHCDYAPERVKLEAGSREPALVSVFLKRGARGGCGAEKKPVEPGAGSESAGGKK